MFWREVYHIVSVVPLAGFCCCKDTTLSLKAIVFYGEYLFCPFKTIVLYSSTAFISAHKQEKLFTINGAWKQRLALFEC